MQDLAVRGEALRRKDAGKPIYDDHWSHNLLALVFGLGAIALVVYFAWRAGLFV